MQNFNPLNRRYICQLHLWARIIQVEALQKQWRTWWWMTLPKSKMSGRTPSSNSLLRKDHTSRLFESPSLGPGDQMRKLILKRLTRISFSSYPRLLVKEYPRGTLVCSWSLASFKKMDREPFLPTRGVGLHPHLGKISKS